MKKVYLIIITVGVVGSLLAAFASASNNQRMTESDLSNELEKTISLAARSTILANKSLNGDTSKYYISSESEEITHELIDFVNSFSKNNIEDLDRANKILELNYQLIADIKKLNSENPDLKYLKTDLENLLISADRLR